MVTVAVDGMGGDHAPDVVVHGAVAAARELDVDVVLVGPAARLQSLVGSHTQRITVHDAPDVIEMHEHPANAVRQKPDSSLVTGVRLVKEGRASAFVSAGNTGAVMTAGLFELRRIQGVDRPALGAMIPTATGKCLLIDVGANVDCKPEHLVQFAHMGAIYLEQVFGVPNPRVGLLSIGEEETKGNALVLAAHPLLRATRLNFIGNVEGRDIPGGGVDVAVCDGFTGNVVLKFAEGMASAITGLIRSEIRSSWLTTAAAVGVAPAFKRVRRRLDYAEYGGVPLLGLNGTCIVAHGRSNATAIKNAIRVAAEATRHDVVGRIAEGIGSAGATAT
ncbi:MAG: phosphate acyltransferase PlsX [Chloroflexota bacterium]